MKFFLFPFVSVPPLRDTIPLCGTFLIVLFTAGCLVSETTEYKIILNEDEKSGMIMTTSRNMQSDAADSAQQERDFNELISNWKSDKYLLDQMNKGLYVQERKLSIEKGKLAWREKSLFSDISKLFPDFNPNDTLRIPLKDTTGLTISTNGRIVTEKDSIVILWSPHTKVFQLKTTTREFKPVSKFAERFRQYLKRQK